MTSQKDTLSLPEPPSTNSQASSPRGIPKWLRAMATNQRRGSVGFNDDEVTKPSHFDTDEDPSSSGVSTSSAASRIVMPSVQINLGVVGSPDMSVQSPPDSDGFYSFNQPQTTLASPNDRSLLLSNDENGGLTVALPTILESVTEQNLPLVTQEKLNQLTIEDDSSGARNDTVFDMDMEETPTRGAVVGYNQQGSREASPEKKVGRLTKAIMKSKWAQNWFFKRSEDETEEETDMPMRSRAGSDAERPITDQARAWAQENQRQKQRQKLREFNMWQPQNL